MPTRVDPKYFGWGNAFLGGIQMADEQNRRNALLENDARMVNLREQQFAADQQMMQAQGQEQQRIRQSRAQFFRDVGLPEYLADDPDAVELIKFMEGGGAPDAKLGNVNPGEFTTASLAAYQKSIDPRTGVGDYSLLVRQFAPPAVSVQNLAGGQSIVDPGNRLGGGTVVPLTTPEQENAAAAGKASAIKTAEQFAEIQAGIQKKGANAVTINNALDLAEPLIDVATGSGAGAAKDRVSAWLGKSSTGADAIAQLKIIQAGLILNMPRLEGPQSDRDQILYREAAGQIGDPTVPNSQKKAAVSMIRSIQEKYADAASGTQQPTRPGQESGGNVIDFSELPD